MPAESFVREYVIRLGEWWESSDPAHGEADRAHHDPADKFPTRPRCDGTRARLKQPSQLPRSSQIAQDAADCLARWSVVVAEARASAGRSKFTPAERVWAS
jgi:hypothetical protein